MSDWNLDALGIRSRKKKKKEEIWIWRLDYPSPSPPLCTKLFVSADLMTSEEKGVEKESRENRWDFLTDRSVEVRKSLFDEVGQPGNGWSGQLPSRE
ncbi:hypothetical protein CEXT_595451 [Caerostris extrusa]|uniref:Uncharacterized protein n=1 Tax=Caerostris extrusa TaxID=172846 RepID=A0AAV4Y1A7_CAEEX|nr:hypothetical protein CEXT_595451 [Caerostris extrusa]